MTRFIAETKTRRYAVIVSLLLSGACGTQNNSTTSCTKYLSCVSVSDAANFPGALQIYGNGGSCWNSLSPDQCSLACDAALDALRSKTGMSSCGQTATPDDPKIPTQDPTNPALDLWEFGTKAQYYTGPSGDPELSGVDPATGLWRCHRDDLNINPTDKEVLRAFEPNDLPDSAIGLVNPLPVDPPATMTGTSYEICPDRSAPNKPDVDAFRFRITAPSNIRVDVRYSVYSGDLDIGLFAEPVFPDTKPKRIAADLSARDNACISVAALPAGRYYVAVRGSNSPDKPSAYSMNRYQIAVASFTSGRFVACP